MRTAVSTLVLSLALGCAGEGPTPSSSATLTTAEGEGVQRIDVEPVAVAPPVAAPEHARITLHALPAGTGEDGEGHVVAASAPVAIDLDGHQFPPRALDPVLTIGALRFTHYGHPHVGVMRFVIADASLLARGLSIAVHYLPDASDERIVIESIGEPELAAAVQP